VEGKHGVAARGVVDVVHEVVVTAHVGALVAGLERLGVLGQQLVGERHGLPSLRGQQHGLRHGSALVGRGGQRGVDGQHAGAQTGNDGGLSGAAGNYGEKVTGGKVAEKSKEIV